MKNYELLYILPASQTSEEIVKNFQDVQKHIEKFGGTMLETLLEHPFLAKTGLSKEEEPEEIKALPVTKRKLAYPIKHEKFGFYCLVNFQAEAGKIEDIDEYLRLNNSVLRHIIIQADPMTKEQLELLQTLFARKKAEQDKEEAEQRESAAAREESKRTYRKESAETKPEKAVKADAENPTEEPVEATETKAEEKAEEAKEEIKEEPAAKKAKETKEKKLKEDKEEEPKEKKAGRKSKIKLEELEDKLDEILEDTIV